MKWIEFWWLFYLLAIFKHIEQIRVECVHRTEFRIIGGTPAKSGEFLGQVSLQNQDNSHICGGVLIDPLHILTAAHCCQHECTLTSVMGDDVSVTINRSRKRQRRQVKNVILHPNFDWDSMQNDIAVIRVDEPFEVTNTFRPMNRSKATPKAGTQCTIVGWGSTINEIIGEATSILQKTNVQLLDLDLCNSSYSYEGDIKAGMLCAGRLFESGFDACKGDSGGLLTCGKSKTLTGIASFGYQCGLPNYPGIYTDVSEYNQWIDDVVATEELPKFQILNYESANIAEKPKAPSLILITIVLICWVDTRFM